MKTFFSRKKMKTTLSMPIILLSVFLTVSDLCYAEPYQPLIILENDVAMLTIKTDAGGRPISYQLKGKPNVFQSNPKNWFEPAPEPTVNAGWKAYDGGIVWIGPQQDFWKRQDKNAKRLAKKAIWPPDPYQIYGRFKVTSLTENEVDLLGPVSEVTGIQLKKRYRLNPDGSVDFSVTGTCRWTKPSSIDLWTLYRFDPNWCAYGAVAKNAKPKFNSGEKITSTLGVIDWQQSNDFVYCLKKEAGLKPTTRKKVRGKVSFVSSEGLQAAIGPKMAFILRYKPTPAKAVHPAQGSSEIYRLITRDGKGLLELENHSAYKTLKPGESVSFSEKWQILPYDGKATPKAHQEFLRTFQRQAN